MTMTPTPKTSRAVLVETTVIVRFPISEVRAKLDEAGLRDRARLRSRGRLTAIQHPEIAKLDESAVRELAKGAGVPILQVQRSERFEDGS